MSRPKAATCIHCGKVARVGREDGFETHLFCTIRCAATYAIEQCMDKRWCSACGDWTDRGYECEHATDTEES